MLAVSRPGLLKTRLSRSLLQSSSSRALVPPAAHVVDSLCIWDTGCHVTALSDDILSGEFLESIKSLTCTAYRRTTQGGESWVVAADEYLAFSNTTVNIPFVAKVVPRENMPNGFSGVLLG